MVAHLQRNPDDLRGWTLLARSYLSNGRYADAVSSFAVAYRLNDGEADLAADYAEALSLVANSVVTEEAHALFVKALKIDKTNAKARYYQGIFQAQQGNIRSALQTWVDLLTLSQRDAPWIPIVKEKINLAAKELGINVAEIEPTPEAQVMAIEIQKAHKKTQAENPTTPGPTIDDVKAALGMTKEDREKMIISMVERLAAKMKENPNIKIQSFEGSLSHVPQLSEDALPPQSPAQSVSTVQFPSQSKFIGANSQFCASIFVPGS